MIKGKKKGFTLVELLIVMSIMFVFMSMIIPKFSGYRDKANYIKAENVGKQIYTAAMMSYMESGGKFDQKKIEDNIKGLVGILLGDESEPKGRIDIKTSDNEKVEIVLSLDNKSYDITIEPETYEFKVSEDEEVGKS